ncbi:MAG: NAD(P)H-quinone oxidoreductase [Rhizobiales bacterium 24-66-13]|nr:MAG: NAD(P)H-quinone oxidoreductase [Rhizobiales bacterium 12-66-7]OYZ82211.1 MAG: NAD(P)H-quinone oxidoreductase [Rhizobiales bacterium 24-66-13]OZA98557.1 MAG: NAD(P)H-quinone oxidoreductase [Rhizobiales bacterium 39-66-18]HQS08201.1 NAD(P)H-quinone oxidoreductase [Xanthobacteraceae bacterium]HQS48529.1 NAD(P)H-quinone oxidoreductase [Xanthobacteraceae bacterium]
MPVLPTTMRQIRFEGSGGPDVIRIETAPVPAPGPGQVLVEVVAAGVNRPDCLQRAGGYPPPPGATDIPGLEIGGRVVALGEGVTSPKIGDEVCALVISGGYAEYCLAEAPLCLPVPKPLSLLEAAGLPENYYTVYDNIFTRGRLIAGETILVHGGSSGIGSTAIQLAKHAGATVFATAGSPDKCDFCLSLGADAAIDYRTADFVAEVKRLTDGKGVDVILDMVGGPYIARNLSALALEGRLVQIAFLQPSRVDIDLMPIMLRRLTLTGSTLRARSVTLKAAIADHLRRDVWPLLESGAVRPVIHATFPLEEAQAAHALMESSAHSGKIMLETGK